MLPSSLGLLDQIILKKFYYCEPRLMDHDLISYDVVQILIDDDISQL